MHISSRNSRIFGNGIYGVPPTFNSGLNKARMISHVLFPISNAHGFIAMSYINVLTCISGLLSPRSPCAIIWRISFFIIHPVKCMLSGRATPQVGEKILEASPSFTDPIINPRGTIGISASVFHARPNIVFPCPTQSVFGGRDAPNGREHASTTRIFAPGYFGKWPFDNRSASTQANIMLFLFVDPSKTFYFKASKRETYSGITNFGYDFISHERDNSVIGESRNGATNTNSARLYFIAGGL